MDQLGNLERIRGLRVAGRVELEQPAVVGVVGTGLVRRLDVLGKDGALGDAWFDDRYSDAERSELLRQTLAQSLERPLRRDVRRLSDGSDASGHRGDVDDRPAAP